MEDIEALEDANRSDQFTQYGFEGFIDQEECEERCVLAEDENGDEVMGFMLTDTNRGSERIYTSLVRPEHRRKRIMTSLFRHVLGDMAKCELPKIVLNVRDHKVGNIKAYKMGGFKEIRRIPC